MSATHSPSCTCWSCRRELTVCSLATFAATIRDAAARIGTAPHERDGARKVFVAALHSFLMDTGHRITIGALTSRLVLAAGADHLELVFADDREPRFVIDSAAAAEAPMTTSTPPKTMTTRTER